MPAALPFLAAVAQAAELTYLAVGLAALSVGISVHNQRKAERAQQEAYENSIKDRYTTVRSSNAVQRLVIGRQRVGGDCVIAAIQHSDKRSLTFVVPVAPHRIDGFEEIWLNDVMDPTSHLDGTSTSSGGGGWVTEASHWSVNVTQPFALEIAGGAPGSTVYLGDDVQAPITVMAVAYEGWINEGSFGRQESRLYEGVDFSISGSTLTWLTDQSANPRIIFNASHIVGTPVVRVKLFLGLEEGERDVELEAASGGKWTPTDILQGVARYHLTVVWNDEKFGQVGVPNSSAVIRGALLWDPVLEVWRWSRNAAHALIHYLTHEQGFARPLWALDDAAAVTAAQISDEDVPSEVITADPDADTITIPDQYLGVGDPVRFWTAGTLPAPLAEGVTYYIRTLVDRATGVYQLAATAGGALIDITSVGTGVSRVMEARYTCDTLLSTDADLSENLRILLGAMCGNISKVAGKIRIKAGAFEAPAYTLHQDDIASEDEDAEWIIDPETPNSDLFNGVRGTYVDASDAGKWAVTSYPPYLSSTYVAQDGGRVAYQDIPLPATIGRQRAQRLAKLTLHLARLSLRTIAPFTVRASVLEQMDTVYAPFEEPGWHTFNEGAGKIFRVEGVVRNPNGRVDLTLREEAEQVYDWDFNEATGDPAPNTAWPDPNFVEPIEGLALATSADTYEVLEGGRLRPYGLFSWQAVAVDSAIRRGGRIQLRWKHAADLQWQQQSVDPDDTEVRAYGLRPGATVIATIQAFNAIQAPSELRTGVYGVSSALPSNEVRASGNLIPDAAFAADVMQQWRLYKHPAMTDHAVWQKDPAIPGPPGSAILYQAGPQPLQVTAHTNPMPVVAGQRYWAYCQMVPVRCLPRVQVTWFDAAGAVLEYSAGSMLSPLPIPPDVRLEANYAYSDLVMAAPAGAASASFLIVVPNGTAEGVDSGVYVLKPFFGPVEVGQATRPVWNAGTAATVGTNQIAPKATYELVPYAQAGSFVLTGALGNNAGAVTSAPATIGPFPVPTTVIITAQCKTVYGQLAPGAESLPRYGPEVYVNFEVRDGNGIKILDSASPKTGLYHERGPAVYETGREYLWKPSLRGTIELPAGATLHGVVLVATLTTLPVVLPAPPGNVTVSDGLLTIEVTKGR